MMDQIITAEAANEGLKLKYNVFKADTGESVGDCFVLRPGKDNAARAALLAYANATKNEALRFDIYDWLEDLEENEESDPNRKCRVCGCTWDNACVGGCYWVESDLCSKCAGKE